MPDLDDIAIFDMTYEHVGWMLIILGSLALVVAVVRWRGR